jgi:hypothetical protein
VFTVADMSSPATSQGTPREVGGAGCEMAGTGCEESPAACEGMRTGCEEGRGGCEDTGSGERVASSCCGVTPRACEVLRYGGLPGVLAYGMAPTDAMKVQALALPSWRSSLSREGRSETGHLSRYRPMSGALPSVVTAA